MFQKQPAEGRPKFSLDAEVFSSPAEPAPRLAAPAPLRYAVLGVLLFLLTGAQGGGAERQSAILAAVFLAVSLIGPMPCWAARHRFSLPVLAVFLYFLLNCAAGLYSRFGSFAAGEFARILAAFCVFAFVVFRARRGEAPYLAAAAAAVSALYGLLSVDAASAQVLSGPFMNFMDEVFGCYYNQLNTGYEEGIRITGIFSNPNFLAGFLALGIFLSLYLVRRAEDRKTRLPACLLLVLNTFSFLLTFSMGAIAAFVIAVLLTLLAERKERRASLFVLLLETAVITLAASFGAAPGLGAQGSALALLPDLLGLAGGVLLWVLHEFGGLRLSALLEGKGRAAAIAAGGLAGVVVLYVILAFNITTGYDLAPGETLRRSVYPEAGTYTLEGDWTGEATVTVESQNRVDTIMHTSTELYSGPLEGASFTVPEDTEVVYLSFHSQEGAALGSVSLSGGPGVKLGYVLLPGFAANRLQGLWANQNAIQRLVFFQDGLRLWRQSPLMGHGLGSVEGLLFSVQDFYYETRYVHNHYIQTLVEMGIPGLLAFVLMLASSLLALLRRRREGEADPLLPALVGCLSVSALHSLTEVDWSIGIYQIMVLLVFGMIAAFFARPLPYTNDKAAGVVIAMAPGLICVIFAVLLYGNLYAERAYRMVQVGLRELTPTTMTELAAIDKYNWSQYELDMAVNAAQSPIREYAATAAEYARHCRTLRIYTINHSLERYVYLPMERYDEFFEASREGIPQAASREAVWQYEFELYEAAVQGLSGSALERLDWFAGQIRRTYDMLVEYNQGRLERITLTGPNLRFLDRILTVEASGLSGQEAVELMNRTLFHSGSAADTDSDGVPDSLGVAGGALTPTGGGWSLSAGAAVTLSLSGYGVEEAVLTVGCSDPAALTVQVDGTPVETAAEGGVLTAALPAAGELSITAQEEVVLSSVELTVPS